MTRADFQTKTIKKQIFYSDFPRNLDQVPFSNDLAVLTNENDIKQALENLILTIQGERLYDNSIGSSSNYNLFNLLDGFEETLATKAIKDTIAQYEPRVQVLQVTIDDDPNNNAYSITIYYTIVSSNQPQNLSIVLKRVR